MTEERKPGSRLYAKSSLEHALAADVRTTCTNAGIVNEPMIQAAIALAVEARRPIWRENPDLTAADDRALRAAASRPTPTDAEFERRNQVLRESMRRPFRSAAKVEAAIAAENAELRSRPLLRAEMQKGAGSAAAVVLPRLEARLTTMNGRARAANASRPLVRK